MNTCRYSLIRVIVILLTMICCNPQKGHVTTNIQEFRIPFVIQQGSIDSSNFFRTRFVNNSLPIFFGRHKFSDTIRISKDFLAEDSSYRMDFVTPDRLPNAYDSLSTEGFQIFVDYNTNIYQRKEYLDGAYFYPVYVVNETIRTLIFKGKDSYTFSIQEAIDTSYFGRPIWRPIENRTYDFCGHGKFGIKVHPGEFVMYLVPKYVGTLETAMRIRLLIGDDLYITKSYQGHINPSQFNIKAGSGIYNDLKYDKVQSIQSMFYGAIPKGYDNKR